MKLIMADSKYLRANMDIIEKGIKESGVDDLVYKTDVIDNVWRALFAQEMYLLKITEDENEKVRGFIIVYLSPNAMLKNMDLVIFAFYGFDNFTEIDYNKGFEALVELAKTVKANRITTYTKLDYIKNKFESLGGKTLNFLEYTV